MNAKAISARSNKPQLNKGCLFLFGLVFFAAGLVAFSATIVAPLWITIRAQSWREVPATILSSEIDESHSSDGTTYRADIKFQYDFENQTYTSKTWNTEWATTYGSRSSATAALQRFPVGTNHPCYVNPNNPERAVLDRSFQLSNLWGLLTLLFIIIGGAVMFGALKPASKSDAGDSMPRSNKLQSKSKANSTDGQPDKLAFASSQSASNGPRESSNELNDGQFDNNEFNGDLINDDDDDDDQAQDIDEETPWSSFEGPQKLKPTESRVTTFVAMVIAATFWNGISWIGFISTIAHREWFATLFLLLFVGVGAILIVIAIYKLLQCFNPVIEVALSNGAVSHGETVDIAWETTGRVDRIRQLRLTIIGEEVVTYVRGTTTSTDRKIFQRIEISSVSDAESKRFGSASVTIPPGTIHSFYAPNNKIQWSIEVHGDIPFWPDVHETMLFAIKPSLGTGEQS